MTLFEIDIEMPMPHDLVWLMMQYSGAPEGFITLCQPIYTGSKQRVKTKNGDDNIPLNVGIKHTPPSKDITEELKHSKMSSLRR